MANRKYIRIALSTDDKSAMLRAKAEAEKQTGINMSESMFVLSVLRHALAKWHK